MLLVFPSRQPPNILLDYSAMWQDFVVKVGLEPNTVLDGLDNLTTSRVQMLMDRGVLGTWVPSRITSTWLFKNTGTRIFRDTWLWRPAGIRTHLNTHLWHAEPVFWGWDPLCCRASFNISLGFIFLSQGNNTILLIVLGYPSRPNLNCLIVVLRCIGRGFWIPDPLWIVDIRWMGKTTINILKMVRP